MQQTKIKSILSFIGVAAWGCACAVVGIAAALENGEPKGPPPNLTINITLNSALDEEETGYYTKIAQDLINKLPRELQLDEHMKLLNGPKDKDDFLNVVAYFPPTVENPPAGLDKVIKHFKVKFNFSDGAKEGEGSHTPMEVVGGETTPVLPKAKEPALEPSPTEPVAQPAPAPSPVAETPAAAPVTAPMPEPAPQVAAAPAPVAKPVEKKTQVVRAETPKNVVETPKTPKLKLAYTADDMELSAEQRKQLIRFVKQVQSTPGIVGYNIIVRSYMGPLGDLAQLGEERMARVTAFLRQQDVNLNSGLVTEIYVQTNHQQFITIEAVQGKS